MNKDIITRQMMETKTKFNLYVEIEGRSKSSEKKERTSKGKKKTRKGNGIERKEQTNKKKSEKKMKE